MDRRMWSELPAELLELSLSFLPLVDRCRFRVVCRRWNDLLCSPEFGACLVVNRQIDDHSCMEHSRWSVLDIREKKWYDLKPEFPWCGRISDMDGGFVCTMAAGSMSSTRQQSYSIVNPKSVIIFNPFGGAVKVLPDPPSFDEELECVFDRTLKLIVDNNSKTFKVLLLSMHGRPCRVPCCIYESSTDQWTTAPMPAFVQVHNGVQLSRVVFQGRLYCCSGFCYDPGEPLWYFNFLDGSWEDTGVHSPFVGSGCRDLAVTDNRLFLTKIFIERTGLWILDISEILLADKTTRTIVQTKLSAVFPIGSEAVSPIRREIRMFGWNKSKLLLHSIDGEVAMYDLASGEWELVPLNPLDNAFRVKAIEAGRMAYCLPNTPW